LVAGSVASARAANVSMILQSQPGRTLE
jgi:hypothetical protein